MPKRNITRIPVVNDLLMEVFGERDVEDPFCTSRPDYYGYAPEWMHERTYQSVDALLLRPPTTWAQAQSYVKAHGESWDGTTKWWSLLKHEAARIVSVGGIVVSIGWDSNGLGKNRGFQMERVLYVAHGSHWRDSVITVERKEWFPTPEDPIF
jgi:hypothetical protein